MPNIRSLLVVTSAAFALLCSFTATANNPFTGQFLVDNRPRELIYVSITQAGSTVSGLMIAVSAVDKGKTEKTIFNLEGIADKTTVTLREKHLLGDYVLTGRKEGNRLILVFPRKNGGVMPQPLVPVSELEYSSKLTEWQKLHADIYKEQSTILKHASALAEQINKIKTTDIPKLLLETSKSLSDQKVIAASFQKRREHFQKLAAMNGLTKCSYVYSQISPFFYSDISGYFYSDFSSVDIKYQQALSDLSERIEHAPEVVISAQNDALLLKETLSKRKFTAPPLPSLPGNERGIFDSYITLAKNSASEVESIKVQYAAIANTIQQTMRESERELKVMESGCRQ